ncbi:cytidylyltransferase domain-containing protein [Effusibacillus consociatus]|uniref:Cytidylyltransferase domain-containing protein n=1 Tax=Effusibacillus consociatus TaxID=1117041 RepID=A0ABV9Q6E4_9BACL
MIQGKTVLAIIPARGGSKGVPRKNIREVAGKPLIAWTIEEAKKSKYIDRLILSTEDAEIMTVAESWGCEVPFQRPLELAQDDTPGIDTVLHAVDILSPKYDYVVLLQPTSPLRTAEDIDGCIEQCVNQGAPACVSVTEPEKSPYWMYTLDEGNALKPLVQTERLILRRQDLPKVYSLNGAVYVAECQWLREKKGFVNIGTVAFPMPHSRSVDVDTEFDLRVVGILLQEIK